MPRDSVYRVKLADLSRDEVPFYFFFQEKKPHLLGKCMKCTCCSFRRFNNEVVKVNQTFIS